jgi:hypothetical protein
MAWIAGKGGQSAEARSDFYIALTDFNGAQFPVFVLVRCKRQATTDRPQAPPPSNGFACERSPFDRGHVCALELGGPDIPQNIVPQWRHWQETGEWRQMEAKRIPSVAKDGDLLLFQVVWRNNLQFDGPPPEVDALQYQAFAAESLVEWDDYRIPEEFRFWHLPTSNKAPGTPAGKAHDTLAGKLGTCDQGSDIVEVLKTLGQPTFTMNPGGMPEEDHSQLERQQLVAATEVFCSVWKGEHERRIDTRAAQIATDEKITRRLASLKARKILGDFSRAGLLVKFGPAHAKVFQQLLLESFNFDHTEVGHFTVERILAAHGAAYPRQACKQVRKRPQAVDFKKRMGSAKARQKALAKVAALASDAMDVDE